jgi:hypothetical protein
MFLMTILTAATILMKGSSNYTSSLTMRNDDNTFPMDFKVTIKSTVKEMFGVAIKDDNNCHSIF